MKYTVWRRLNDAEITSVLLDIARAYPKLALEYSSKNTLPCRKEVIKAEIQRLRKQRDVILELIVQNNNAS
ncbi:hypothetical protein AB4Z17_30460 [Paenibacillus sp. TAF43_2]|uniref:hypothetical protein n=1 Tax=Paenibacillus sp. TAF43_2 TaxID=3233069 RepID=UPI003F97184E